MDYDYNIVKNNLNFDSAGKWLKEDSKDDFFPDVFNFNDVDQKLEEYLKQREHKLLQIDSFSFTMDFVPKKNGMIREAIYLHPIHRILYLSTLHYLLPKIDHHLPAEVYSYRLDTENKDEYPFPNRAERWKTFHNDFRQACLDDSVNAVLLTDIASFYDHIEVDQLITRIQNLLGSSISKVDKNIIEFLRSLLKQWTQNGYGIPQNLDASSFYGSMYLSSADTEIIEKRYKYFRWVDDIRICASNQKQAIRALHDLQKALGRYRLFLASDKTKIILKGTSEFDSLVDVEDDVLISKIEEATISASKQDIDTIYVNSKNQLEFHSENNGDDRKFRAFANRLLDISEFKEYHNDLVGFVTNIVKPRLETHTERSDYWIKMLSEADFSNWENEIYKLLKEDSSVYNWQRFYLWKLLTNSETTDPKFLELAKSLLHSPVSDLEAYQAIIFIGRHGNNTDREILFTQHFSAQKTYPIQRAILIGIQELDDQMKQIYFNRALDLTKEHKQLIEYLRELKTPKYGIRKRPKRELKQEPPPIKPIIKTGIGKVKGRVVRFRIAKNSYDYE